MSKIAGPSRLPGAPGMKRAEKKPSTGIEPRKMDVYDQEFVANLRLAKTLIDQVHSPKDKDICKKWLAKLCVLKTNDTTVKRNRNSFFQYFLQVLHKCIQAGGPKGHEGDPQIDRVGPAEDKRDFMCRWSDDGRTYVAAKPLPGQGTLVYMAVAKEPRLGWERNGELFKFY